VLIEWKSGLNEDLKNH